MTFKQSSDLRLALSETRKIGTNCLTQEKSWLFAPSSNRDRAIKRIIAKLNQDKVRVSYEIRYLYLNRWQLRLYFRSKRATAPTEFQSSRRQLTLSLSRWQTATVSTG